MKVTTLMGEYLHKWGKGVGVTTKEDVYDLVGLEWLFEICSLNLKLWFVDRKPKDPQSVGRLANKFVDRGLDMGTVHKGTGPGMGPRKGSLWMHPSSGTHINLVLEERMRGVNLLQGTSES